MVARWVAAAADVNASLVEYVGSILVGLLMDAGTMRTEWPRKQSLEAAPVRGHLSCSGCGKSNPFSAVIDVELRVFDALFRPTVATRLGKQRRTR